jgi:carbamoylphosphate synthase large subunit
LIKKILIVGISDYLNPIIQILKKKKIRFYLVGLNNKKTKFNKKIIKINYLEKEKILKIAKKIGITHIIPDCNDTSYLTASYIANKLKIQGYEQLRISKLLLNKRLFYFFCLKNKIKIPKFYYCKKKELLKKNIKFPILIKPEESYSGIGIIKFTKKKILKRINYKNKLLFSEFIRGKLYSHSCFVNENKIVNSYFVREYCLNYPYTVDFSKIERRRNNKSQEKVVKVVNKLIKLLKIQSGLVHTQYIVNKNNIYLIEVTRRLPGDFYSELIKLSYGNNNYLNNYINNFVGLKFSIKEDKFHKSLRKNYFINEKIKLKKILKNYKIFNEKKNKLKNNTLTNFDINNKKKYVLVANYQ